MVEKYDSLAANTTASLHAAAAAAAAALFVSWQEHRRPYNNCGSKEISICSLHLLFKGGLRDTAASKKADNSCSCGLGKLLMTAVSGFARLLARRF